MSQPSPTTPAVHQGLNEVCEDCGDSLKRAKNHFLEYAPGSNKVCKQLTAHAKNALSNKSKFGVKNKLVHPENITEQSSSSNVQDSDILMYLYPLIVDWHTEETKTRFLERFDPRINELDCQVMITYIKDRLQPLDAQNATSIPKIDFTVRDHLRRSLQRLCVGMGRDDRLIWPRKLTTNLQTPEPTIREMTTPGPLIRELNGVVYAVKTFRGDQMNDHEKRAGILAHVLVWWHLDHRRLLKLEGITDIVLRQDANASMRDLETLQRHERQRRMKDIPVPGLMSRWMKNGSIKSYIEKFYNSDRNPLPAITELEPLVKTWMVHVAEGLDYLHQEGVTHGDLHIDNVLLTDELDAQICDFGLSLYTNNTSGRGKSDRSTSHLTVPPEILMNENDKVRQSPQGDIWAYGLLCIRMFMNHHPYCKFQSSDGKWIQPDLSQLLVAWQNEKTRDRFTPTRPSFHGGKMMSLKLWNIIQECFTWQALKESKRPQPSAIAKKLGKIKNVVE